MRAGNNGEEDEKLRAATQAAHRDHVRVADGGAAREPAVRSRTLLLRGAVAVWMGESVVMLFDPRKDQWWNADNKFQAYYMTLRVHYDMCALEAFQMAKDNFAKHPEFMGDMIGTLRRT